MKAPVRPPKYALQVDYLTKRFHLKGNKSASLTAVENLNLRIAPGETVALVGESGSGKSTAARCIVQLLEPSSGSIAVNGVEVAEVSRTRHRKLHKDIQLVFQDPNASLNPRQTVRQILMEPLNNYFEMALADRERRVSELLEAVELDDSFLDRRAKQISGGQRQRVGMARALAVEPRVIVLDEPTASLDVSTRGQMLSMLDHVQRSTGIAFLLISHDLAVVRSVADRVMVMYLGGIVEAGPTQSVFDRPLHPYTRALLGAAPKIGYRQARSGWRLNGEMPSPVDRPTGCLLTDRCPIARDVCSDARPPLLAVEPEHFSACLFADELAVQRDSDALA